MESYFSQQIYTMWTYDPGYNLCLQENIIAHITKLSSVYVT